jgi:excisionase family DNA binding protein
VENNESLVLTPSQVRKMLSCSRSVVYAALKNGVIPSRRISPRKIIIPRQRFFDWLEGGGSDELHP